MPRTVSATERVAPTSRARAGTIKLLPIPATIIHCIFLGIAHHDDFRPEGSLPVVNELRKLIAYPIHLFEHENRSKVIISGTNLVLKFTSIIRLIHSVEVKLGLYRNARWIARRRNGRL